MPIRIIYMPYLSDIWEFPKNVGVLFWGPCLPDPVVLGPYLAPLTVGNFYIQ